MKKTYLEGGRICTSHGVKGLMKAEHMCDNARVLLDVEKIYFLERDGSYTERRVHSCTPMGQFVLIGVDGISSREEAIAYRGRIFYLHRDDIPLSEGAMFIADMIGLPVYHVESGESLGKISEVNEIGGRRIYSVDYNGQQVMIPDVPQFIKEISEERGMAVLPIPGLFGGADEV